MNRTRAAKNLLFRLMTGGLIFSGIIFFAGNEQGQWPLHKPFVRAVRFARQQLPQKPLRFEGVRFMPALDCSGLYTGSAQDYTDNLVRLLKRLNSLKPAALVFLFPPEVLPNGATLQEKRRLALGLAFQAQGNVILPLYPDNDAVETVLHEYVLNNFGFSLPRVSSNTSAQPRRNFPATFSVQSLRLPANPLYRSPRMCGWQGSVSNSFFLRYRSRLFPHIVLAAVLAEHGFSGGERILDTARSAHSFTLSSETRRETFQLQKSAPAGLVSSVPELRYLDPAELTAGATRKFKKLVEGRAVFLFRDGPFRAFTMQELPSLRSQITVPVENDRWPVRFIWLSFILFWLPGHFLLVRRHLVWGGTLIFLTVCADLLVTASPKVAAIPASTAGFLLLAQSTALVVSVFLSLFLNAWRRQRLRGKAAPWIISRQLLKRVARGQKKDPLQAVRQKALLGLLQYPELPGTDDLAAFQWEQGCQSSLRRLFHRKELLGNFSNNNEALLFGKEHARGDSQTDNKGNKDNKPLSRAMTDLLDLFLQVQKELDGLSALRRENFGETPHIKAALLQGECRAGSFGEDSGFSVRGKLHQELPVLFRLNRYYESHLLVGLRTSADGEALQEEFALRRLDPVRLLPDSLPVTVYELVTFQRGIDPDTARKLTLFRFGMTAYEQRDWYQAARMFQEILDLDVSDVPARKMLVRCRRFQQEPPPDSWSGILRAGPDTKRK